MAGSGRLDDEGVVADHTGILRGRMVHRLGAAADKIGTRGGVLGCGPV